MERGIISETIFTVKSTIGAGKKKPIKIYFSPVTRSNPVEALSFFFQAFSRLNFQNLQFCLTSKNLLVLIYLKFVQVIT